MRGKGDVSIKEAADFARKVSGADPYLCALGRGLLFYEACRSLKNNCRMYIMIRQPALFIS